MSQFTNQQVFHAVKNGSENILFYLSKKYLHRSRRLLIHAGVPEELVPGIYADILVRVYREIQWSDISQNLDFENYFFNSLNSYEFEAVSTEMQAGIGAISNADLAEACYSILDDAARKVLSLRLAEKLSFEEIAARMSFSNPVIAQFEFEKAFVQLEKIASARMNMEYVQ